jgi:hypothetical protein
LGDERDQAVSGLLLKLAEAASHMRENTTRRRKMRNTYQRIQEVGV